MANLTTFEIIFEKSEKNLNKNTLVPYLYFRISHYKLSGCHSSAYRLRKPMNRKNHMTPTS